MRTAYPQDSQSTLMSIPGHVQWCTGPCFMSFFLGLFAYLPPPKNRQAVNPNQVAAWSESWTDTKFYGSSPTTWFVSILRPDSMDHSTFILSHNLLGRTVHMLLTATFATTSCLALLGLGRQLRSSFIVSEELAPLILARTLGTCCLV